MNVQTLFRQINWAYRGSDDEAPADGSGDDYTMWLDTANRKLSEYARDSKVSRQSLFGIQSVGTYVSGTVEYNITADFILPADSVIMNDGVNDYFFKIIKPQERDSYTQNEYNGYYGAVYIYGANPRKLVFVDPIPATSSLIGKNILIAAYFMPPELATDADIILVDDPYWLVYATASELAFNDITYSDKSADLNNKANSLYSQMTHMNRNGTYGNPRTATYRVNRIRNTGTGE